jgi:hypothetical protein
MHWSHREPTLDEILSDSITKAVMAADGVNPRELTAMLRRLSRNSSPVLRGWPWAPRATSCHQPAD